MRVEGLPKLIAQLLGLAEKEPTVSVSVGFQTNYALFVHENLQAHHPVGQAKYLEQPARQLSNDGTLANIVKIARQQGKTTAQGLLLAGLRIQREAQLLCPVDTAQLKNSAFTKLDEGPTAA